MNIIGYKKGGGGSHTPVEVKDNLHSTAYAKVLDLVSEGEIVGLVNGLQSIYLDETPLANQDNSLNFKGVTVDFRPGSQEQTHVEGFPSVENEIGVGVDLTDQKPWVHAVNNLQLSAVRIRLAVDGLSKANTSNGDINGYRVEYAIDISTDHGAFIEVLRTAFDGKTTSRYERSHRVNLPTAREGWSVRVRRITPNANSSTIGDKTGVVSVTEIIDAKLRYPMSALVGIQVDASQFQSVPVRAYDMKLRIIKVPSNYNPETRVYEGIWDGTFKPAWTNNPAWIFYDLVLNDRYGLGHLITASQVDKWALYKIAQYADELVSDGKGGSEPRFSCNVYIQSRKEAYAVLQDMASMFRGITYWAGGGIITSADIPAEPVYTYTAANVIDGKFTRVGSNRKTRYTVALVSWNDPSDFYRAKVEYVADDEGIKRYGVQQLEITAFGCTSQGEAQRRGNWALMTSRLETGTISFAVGLDGIIAAPGQIVRIADPHRMGKRSAGRILSASARTVVLDKTPAISVGDQLTVILSTGVAETKTVVNVQGESITISSAWSVLPVKDAVWSVDSIDLVAPTYRIMGVTEKEGLVYEIYAVQYEPGKFDYIDEASVINPRPQTAKEVVPKAPFNLNVTESLYIVGLRSFGIRVNISWTGNASKYEVSYRKTSDIWVTATTNETSIDLYGFDESVYEFSITAISSIGIRSQPTLHTQKILGLKMVPGDVSSFLVDGNTMSWGQVHDLDIDGYKIRYHYGHNRDWDSANPLHNGVLTQCPYTPEIFPQGPITLMIKAVDTSGNESAKPAVIQTQFGNLLVANVIESYDFKEWGYPGIVMGGSRVDGALEADSADDLSGEYESMSYQTLPIMPLSGYVGSNMTLDLGLTGEAMSIEYRMFGEEKMYPNDAEIFYKDDDVPFYSKNRGEYIPWPGQVGAQRMLYQFNIATNRSEIQGKVDVCGLLIDVPDVVEKVNDIVISSRGTRLPLMKKFIAINNIQITLQDDGGTAIGVRIVDKDCKRGPLITCIDTAGNWVAGIIDATIQGY